MAGPDLLVERRRLVKQELKHLGIDDKNVINALLAVPREEFVSKELREFSYKNAPLPIGQGQTISQPLIVAQMAQALRLSPDDRVLEVGAGSGYAAAVLSHLCQTVFSIERLPELAKAATARLERLGYNNVFVLCGDGTLGWPEEAPFDAITVAAGSPQVPPALLQQLKVGGRLVIPVGRTQESQQLLRVTRRGPKDFDYEDLGAVRFVPLIGASGWQPEEKAEAARTPRSAGGVSETSATEIIRKAVEPFRSLDEANLAPLLKRVGDARVVLIGEATHGTSEFYRFRARITQALIEQKGFNFVAVEADWPDAYRIHDFVVHRQRPEPSDWEAFSRFPTWMWRNQEVLDFIHWLREFNLRHATHTERVGFYGLDLYSMFRSISRVLEYLESIDPPAAQIARVRYGCLTPWEEDPAAYGQAALAGRYETCEPAVVQMLKDMMQRQVAAALRNGEDLFDAQLNAKLVADAEKYYRLMYYGSDESWNHRDTHMFETLQLLLNRRGPASKAVIWAHNSHLGNAAATQFGARGQINIGQLCREEFGDRLYAIGQGTHHGTVAAASHWEGNLEMKQVRPAHPQSYERLMHLTEMDNFLLPITYSFSRELRTLLTAPRLERAIGVIYRPETEIQSHYFSASLARQFDEWIWFNATTAVRPLVTHQIPDHEPPHPFAVLDR